ncbi:tripartite tricarboxylate transporter TctB family protein [Pararhizobium mangrovi]|uniref:Tripartite tricarboxylate transporter TctB family protein n=1 Tax=Pararhizobium mangrovi TaxID=2590452 RepID=A0A506UG06_9HYPH|nr:tripartite tricarboxylate transporter TctB family protein [Pararhizobium mangrovi]TPW31879.1 tripartite tricarboxylate transporter TctB family protein [Pararhizobium mangrovi]
MKLVNFRRIEITDLIAGGLVTVVGLFAAIRSLASYPLGSASRMGPGYYPMLIGGVLIVLGLCIAFARAFQQPTGEVVDREAMPLGEDDEEEDIRSVLRDTAPSIVLVPCAIALFGFLLERAGLIPACVGLTVVSVFAASHFSWVRLVELIVAIPIIAYLIFVVGLGLPFELVKGWF